MGFSGAGVLELVDLWRGNPTFGPLNPELSPSVILPIFATLGTVGLAFGCAVFSGLLIGSLAAWFVCRDSRRRADRSAVEIEESAHRKAELIAEKARSHVGIEVERQEMEIEARLREIRSHEESIGGLDHQLALRERELERERESVAGMSRDLRRTMEKLAGMNGEEVKASLREQVREECQEDLRLLRKDVLEKSERELQDEARRVRYHGKHRAAPE